MRYVDSRWGKSNFYDKAKQTPKKDGVKTKKTMPIKIGSVVIVVNDDKMWTECTDDLKGKIGIVVSEEKIYNEKVLGIDFSVAMKKRGVWKTHYLNGVIETDTGCYLHEYTVKVVG
jgi:hypothetical protein